MATAMQLATSFAKDVSKRANVPMRDENNRYGIRVRNKREQLEWDGTRCEASITYEGLDEMMIAMTLETKWINAAKASGFFFEPIASWQIAVFKI